MGNIPDDKVQEVRDRVDIVDLVGRYVELRRAGRNYKGRCPFHEERTPSFNVNPERRGYKCFGCGAGGDAIRFIMEAEGMSFPEAVRKLADLYGVTLPAASGRHEGPRTHERDEAYAITRAATTLYQTLLRDAPVGEAARAYLRERELSPAMVEEFRLGYAPAPSEGGWDTLCKALTAAGLSLERAESLGLVGRSERTGRRYDRFRGRLMFPVIHPGGEVIAFSGRIVPPHDTGEPERPPPKYLNSAESVLFHKSKHLFGLFNARPAIRSQRCTILVEGNIDVVKLHAWGHRHTVAPLGTALTLEQARLIARFADQVIVCFDGDRAGKKAAWTALPQLLAADLDVRIVLLPEDEDPDSIGAERFAAHLTGARAALEELMLRIAARAGDAAHARATGLDRVLPLVAQVPRASARDLYADRAAQLFGVPRARVESALRALLAGEPVRSPPPPDPQENSRPKLSTSGPAVPLSAPVRSLPLPAGQAQLAMLLVDVPHLASLAERTGALPCVSDDRLSPIVRTVVDAAKRGEDPNMSSLLELVDPSEQQQVYESVFAGRYRDVEEPQLILHELVTGCRREQLQDQIRAMDREIAAARRDAQTDSVRQLSQRRLELLRERDALSIAPMGALADTPVVHN